MKRTWLIPLLCSASLRLCGNPISSDDATNAIVGEAASSPVVMVGIADALHNRAEALKRPLHGVYGFNAPHNAGESPSTWAAARSAWLDTAPGHAKHGTVKGAIYFGNGDDVRKGTFTGLHLTVTLGDGKDKTYFFKP